MRGSAASVTSRRRVPWLRKHGGAVCLAACFLFVAAAVGWLIQRGLGTFAQPAQPFTLPQVFLGAGLLLLACIAVKLQRERDALLPLRKIAALHALLSKYSRDAIILADLSGHRQYGSASAEDLGWKPEELLTEGSLEMVHSEDRQCAQAIIRELKSGGTDAMLECRIRKNDGEYTWVEASLHVVRDPETGSATGVLGIIRDVSQRKLAEQRLREAYNAVEALSVTDELTGLANRRRFDEYLGTEWLRSIRDRQPLSLLMLDVDKFKAYNDTYGHQRGDSCLKQVAEACLDVVSRPGDLVARFGGEEFVVVLPNTESDGALHVATNICEALRSRKLPHSGNRPGVVTISAGYATLIPHFGKHAPELIEMADQALYKAKSKGRNRVCGSNGTEDLGKETPVSALPKAARNKTV